MNNYNKVIHRVLLVLISDCSCNFFEPYLSVTHSNVRSVCSSIIIISTNQTTHFVQGWFYFCIRFVKAQYIFLYKLHAYCWCYGVTEVPDPGGLSIELRSLGIIFLWIKHKYILCSAYLMINVKIQNNNIEICI